MSDVTVTHAQAYQGVTLWTGDESGPIHLDDTDRQKDMNSWFFGPVQRAVAVARLRAIADMIAAIPAQDVD